MFRYNNRILAHSYLNNKCLLNHGKLKCIRTLYSRDVLGVDNYVRTREKIGANLVNMSEKFKMKMEEYSKPSSKDMIFTEDLKNMIHISQPKSEDITTVVNMMKKFHVQNNEVRFGSFVFGPVIMRMFYYLNDYKSAYNCFMDPEMKGFFDQLMSYQILMDLLYEHDQFDKVFKVFDYIKEQQIQGAKYPKHVVVLIFATLYKQNTPASLKYAITLWSELMTIGHVPMRRAATFIAGLALLQKEPNIALEVVSTVKQQNYMTIRNIKVVALGLLGRPGDAIPVLRSVLEIDSSSGQTKQTFSREAVGHVREALKLMDSKVMTVEFNRIDAMFEKQGLYSEASLDSLLTSEIINTGQNSPQNHNKSRDRKDYAPRYQDQQLPSSQRMSARLGLNDYE